jgi:N-acetylneuraminate synthase
MPHERSIDVDSYVDLEITEAFLASRGIQPVKIDGRTIGPGHSCFIIAEAGVNHNGDLNLARELVCAAAEAGADAVKFQTFCAEQLASCRAPKAVYQLNVTDTNESQLAMLKRLELSAAYHHELSSLCHDQGVTFLSSPFDERSADFLEELCLVAFKIPSGEITNLSFLQHVARKNRPMIVSTGMSALHEVQAALRAIAEVGDPRVILLHCVSNYPADPMDVNLLAMKTMSSAFGVPVGYSDHTEGTEIALAAVALGACVIEKHFTIDRSLPGPDHCASIEPQELSALVRGIRKVEASLGNGAKVPAASEATTAAVVRKSLVASRDIPAGATVTGEMITLKRPGTGLPPSMRDTFVGRITRREIPKDTLLTLEDVL